MEKFRFRVERIALFGRAQLYNCTSLLLDLLIARVAVMSTSAVVSHSSL